MDERAGQGTRYREGASRPAVQKPRSPCSGAEGTAAAALFSMQLCQLQHDERYHRDITLLPVGERMKHMALHMAKYAAKFVVAADQRDDPTPLIDALIISLASANTLNLNLGERLDGAADHDLIGLGQDIRTRRVLSLSDPMGFVRQFAAAMGALAKAAESLDHMEAFPSRAVMEGAILDMMELLLGEAELRQINVRYAIERRLSEVETRNIFHRPQAAVDGVR